MANEAGVQYVSDQGDSGTCIGKAATDLVATYGATPVVQADAIPAITGTVNLTTTINAILTVIRNFGLIASA